MKKIELEQDWFLLLEELQKSGVSKEQFKDFLESKKTENKK